MYISSSKVNQKKFISYYYYFTFREVLCLEFVYLRLLTGCADGKIRIWSVLSGFCLRVMRGNSVSDPVTSLTATPNRLFFLFRYFL
jgi:WD40 repeat protein